MENLVGMDNNDAAIRFHTTADIHLMMLDDVLWCWPTTSSKYFDMNYFDFSSIYHDISTKEKRTPIEIYLNMWCVWKWGAYMVFTSICPKFQWQFQRVSSEKSWKNIKFRRSDLHRAAWGHTNATHEVHPDSQGCVKDIVGKYILLDVYVAHRWDIVRRLFWDTKKLDMILGVYLNIRKIYSQQQLTKLLRLKYLFGKSWKILGHGILGLSW